MNASSRSSLVSIEARLSSDADGVSTNTIGVGSPNVTSKTPIGEWPSRLKDVAEIDVIEEQLAHSEYVDAESRKLAIEGAQRIDEIARQRGMGGDLET